MKKRDSWREGQPQQAERLAYPIKRYLHPAIPLSRAMAPQAQEALANGLEAE